MANPVRIRTSTGWQDLALVGPQGPQGPEGPQGPQGPAGTGGGDTSGLVSKTGDTMTGPLVLPLGTGAATSLNFGTAGLGLFGASGQLNLAASGVPKISIRTTDDIVYGAARNWFLAGTAAAPSVVFGQTTTGLYGATDQINVAVSGADKLSVGSAIIASTVPIAAPAGSFTAPSYAFVGNTDLGMYRAAANLLGFGAAGAPRLTVSSSAIATYVPLTLPNSGTATSTTLNFGTLGTGLYGSTTAVRIASAGVEHFAAESGYLYAQKPMMSYHVGSQITTNFNFGSLGTGFHGDASNVHVAVGNVTRFSFGSTQHVSAVPIVLSADPTVALHAATKQYVDNKVPATPIDVLARTGLQVNGSGLINQLPYNGGAISNAMAICDGWSMWYSGTMVLAPSQIGNPIVAGAPYGYLGIHVQSPQASLGATEYTLMSQRIEGFRTHCLAWGTANAQPITIGFWSKHDTTGVFTVAVRNGASDRSYVTTYTHAAQAVAQFNVVTIPGCTDGVWPSTETVGLSVSFSLGAGATRTAPSANTWHNANYHAAPGQVNAVATANKYFFIGGLVVLPGTQAITAAHSPRIVRLYDEELLLAQRYLWVSNLFAPRGGSGGSLAGHTIGNAILYSTWRFTVPMCRNPSLQIWSVGVQNRVRNSNDGTFIGVSGVSNTYFNHQGGCIIACTPATPSTWVDFDMVADAKM